jgi:hypothetical protein
LCRERIPTFREVERKSGNDGMRWLVPVLLFRHLRHFAMTPIFVITMNVSDEAIQKEHLNIR